jgi:hypothetical protein
MPMNEAKFEKHMRKMYRNGCSRGDLIDYVQKDIMRDITDGKMSKKEGDSEFARCVEIITELVREERMNRFNVRRGGSMGY